MAPSGLSAMRWIWKPTVMVEVTVPVAVLMVLMLPLVLLRM